MMDRPQFPTPPRHFNDAALDRFFWQQREEWHSTALAEALDEVSRNWHEQKLSLARAKLSEMPS